MNSEIIPHGEYLVELNIQNNISISKGSLLWVANHALLNPELLNTRFLLSSIDSSVTSNQYVSQQPLSKYLNPKYSKTPIISTNGYMKTCCYNQNWTIYRANVVSITII